jgi:hypothetical protein
VHKSDCEAGTTLEFTIPIRTGQGLNAREHWAVKADRVQRERHGVILLFPRRKRLKPPYDVHLVRISPSASPMDDDNVVGALKAIRDEVAAQLQVDDGDKKRIRFTYGDERGLWGVRIKIEGSE